MLDMIPCRSGGFKFAKLMLFFWSAGLASALLALSWENSIFGHVTTLRPLLRSHLGDSGRAGTTMQTAKATMAEVANVSTLQECSSHASNARRHAPRQLPKPA